MPLYLHRTSYVCIGITRKVLAAQGYRGTLSIYYVFVSPSSRRWSSLRPCIALAVDEIGAFCVTSTARRSKWQNNFRQNGKYQTKALTSLGMSALVHIPGGRSWWSITFNTHLVLAITRRIPLKPFHLTCTKKEAKNHNCDGDKSCVAQRQVFHSTPHNAAVKKQWFAVDWSQPAKTQNHSTY